MKQIISKDCVYASFLLKEIETLKIGDEVSKTIGFKGDL